MLSEDMVTALCTRYGIGVPTAALLPVTGGLIHRLYRLSTATGTFAVKFLNPEIMRHENIRDEFRRSERIAAAFAEAGVPAVAALEVPGGTVQDLYGVTVIVYRWHEGKVLSKSASSPDEAYQIGAVLGRMHALDLRHSGEKVSMPLPLPEPIDKGPWEALLNLGQRQGIEWASAMKTALPDLLAWDRDRIAADAALPQALVMSHCDLDQKNVIWHKSSMPLLVDWESAGLIRPGAELIGAALDWSGQSAGLPGQAVFAAVLAGYRQEIEFDARQALLLMRSRLASWIDWLGANMHRSLSSETASADEKAVSLRETRETLSTMYTLAGGMEEWAKWCI